MHVYVYAFQSARRILLRASDATEQSDWIAAILKATPPSICNSTFVPTREQDGVEKDVQICRKDEEGIQINIAVHLYVVHHTRPRPA